MPGNEKRFVYIIRSDVDPSRHYTGIIGDVSARLDWHNHGPCGCTIHNCPWYGDAKA
jgi:predicted GIY-YIG superfamily endonuclease